MVSQLSEIAYEKITLKHPDLFISNSTNAKHIAQEL